MKLTNKIIVTKGYEGKSKFAFWQNVNKGDILEISMNLKPTGHNRGKIYAPSISATNIMTGEKFTDTINSFQKYLEKISYKE